MVFTRYEGKLRTVNFYRRPLTHAILKVLATSRKIAPVSLFSPKSLDTLNEAG